jgi:hypothetical protein
MSEFSILHKRINQLWEYFAEIENLLYIGPSESPEIAADKIKREIQKLQQFAQSLHAQKKNPLPAQKLPRQGLGNDT